MSLVVFDTSLVIILAGGDSALPRAKERVDDLVAELLAKHVTIGIPAAALAECCHCDESVWSSLRVLDLNAPAAILANQLAPGIKKAAGKKAGGKQCVKYDALILATAVVKRATALYTTDDWFAKAASRHKLNIAIRGLPEVAMKQRSFADSEDE